MGTSIAKHLARSYGNSIGVWWGIILTAASQAVMKIGVPVWVATWLAPIATGHPLAPSGAAYLAVFFAVAIALGALADYIFVKVTDARYEALVAGFHANILEQDVDFYRDNKIGKLGALFRGYLDGTVNVFRLIRTGIVPLLFSTIVPAFVILFYDTKAALVFSLGVAARAGISVIGFPKIQELRKQALALYEALSGVVADHMLHQRIVRVSANEAKARAEVSSLAAEEGRLFWIRHRAATVFDAVANVVAAVCFVSIFFVLEADSLRSKGGVETIIVILFFVLQGMQAAQAAGELHQKLAEHLMKVRSALHTMDQARFTYHWGSNGLDASKRVSLRFEDVSFGYSGGNVGEPVLKNFSLSIPAGEHVALVGRNGAGKSTLLNLIMRFDEPQDGRIFIGNSELHMLTKKGLYSAIGYVPQDAKLMNSSIEENLFYFNDHVTTERTDAVFRAVGIPAVIRRRPDGLCARVGELGDQLSGGERQRIAIARALLREGAVYLMDEPTSSIEDDDALQVVRNVRELLRGKTMLFVTHSPQIENMFENVVRVEAGSAVWERSRFNGPHRAE